MVSITCTSPTALDSSTAPESAFANPDHADTGPSFSSDQATCLKLLASATATKAKTEETVKEVKRVKTLLLSARSSLVEALPPLHGAIGSLCLSINQAFHAEKQQLLGGSSGGAQPVIDFNQPAESFARLDQSVRRLMAEYTAHGSQDWQQFMAFNPHHYVRHLIDATDDYELILICWGKGQVSRVHNHGTSHCWLTCLKGEVEEKQYALHPDPVEHPSSPRSQKPEVPGVLCCIEPCPELDQTTTHLLGPGATGYINDHVCLHSVGCGPSVGEPGAVTLHLYAPPIRRVQLYEPEEDRVTTRVPGFFSVRGVHT